MTIQNRIPNNIIKWIFPKGLNYSEKLYYGKSDLCFCLSTNPSCAISLNELSREMQIKALYNARHLYIKSLIRVERQKQQIYKEYIKMIKTKRKMLKDKYELNNLKDDLLHRSS